MESTSSWQEGHRQLSLSELLSSCPLCLLDSSTCLSSSSWDDAIIANVCGYQPRPRGKAPSSSSERAQSLSRAGTGLRQTLAVLCCCVLVVGVELARADEVDATSESCWFVFLIESRE